MNLGDFCQAFIQRAFEISRWARFAADMLWGRPSRRRYSGRRPSGLLFCGPVAAVFACLSASSLPGIPS